MHALLKLALPLAMIATVPAHATVYDLTSDFSNVGNPNGAWSFTYAATPLSHFAQPGDGNSLNLAAANGYWGMASSFNVPTFIVKTTADGAATSPHNNGDFLAGDVLVHGPNDGSAIAINWTAPTAGTISFTSSIWYAHSPVARSQDVSAFINATALGSLLVSNGITRSSALASLSGSSLTVAAGDVLSFRFSKSVGQQFGSLTGINAIVDFQPANAGAVPEPATWAMMICGFGLVGGAMRRRSPGRVRLA